MMPKPRPFEAKQLRTHYRTWELIATAHEVPGRYTVTGKKKSNGEYFEIGRLTDMQTALDMGKRKVDRLEGVQEVL